VAQRRFHYEAAFEQLLRRRRVPYVAVDEAKKALLPEGSRLRLTGSSPDTGEPIGLTLKSFDFVVYEGRRSLLVDVKGRKIIRRKRAPLASGRMESWVTEDDVTSLAHWRDLFGEGYTAAFVFVYWCDAQPPDGLFQELFEHRGRWYAVRAVELDAYRSRMTQRSVRWKTVHLATADFDQLSQPFGSWAAWSREPAVGEPTPSSAATDAANRA